MMFYVERELGRPHVYDEIMYKRLGTPHRVTWNQSRRLRPLLEPRTRTVS